MAATSQSRASRGVPVAGGGVQADPTVLTLQRSADLARRQRQDRLLAEVAELRQQNAALRSQRASLEQQLAETRPDDRRMDGSFTALGRQAVFRHLGVWAAADRPSSDGGRRTAVRFRLDDGQPSHTLQLEQPRQKGAAVTASVRDLPPGVQLDTYLEQHGTAAQVSRPALHRDLNNWK